ncbi:hypothetical protein [Pseudooceanicola nanhaiensis]|uniref:hypothetical protein n=1 Tax=Pseudooceanicola nanhaiensis TaxID=375761 RepID=UPI001CD23B9C|nr:hypothetical protein [Pseudooceanicola nanhaiensis]MCA0922774.1 hypothetical protein [Pseudooceanicola nanhaiensis]
MPQGNILVSSARSGTNYFLSVYSKCFPDAFVVKEIFREGGDSLPRLEELLGVGSQRILKMVENNPLRLWRNIKEACAEEEIPALAKIFYYHVEWNAPLWENFRKNDRVIHLIRQNPFDVFLSHKVAQQTGQWQKFARDGEAAPVEPLVLDPEELSKFIERQGEHIEKTRSFFKDANFSEIYYEDIAKSTEDCVAAISKIFEIDGPKQEVKIPLKRQKSATNQELVANYDEVAMFDKATF